MPVRHGISRIESDNDEIAQSRDAINMLAHSQRSVNHAMVLPNYNHSAQLEGMQRVKEQYEVGAWKCYTPWGSQNILCLDLPWALAA